MRDVQHWRRRGLLLACVAVGLITPPVAVAAGSAVTHADQEAMARFEQVRDQAAAETPRSRIQVAAETKPTASPSEAPTSKPRKKSKEPDDVRFAKDAVRDWPVLPDDAEKYQVKVRVTNQSDDDAKLTGWIDFNRDNKRGKSERATATVEPTTSVREVKLTWSRIGDLDPGEAKVSLRLPDKENTYTVQIEPAPDKGCDTGDDTKDTDKDKAGQAPDDYGDLSDSATHPADGLRYAVSTFGSLVRWDPATGEHDSSYLDAVIPQGA